MNRDNLEYIFMQKMQLVQTSVCCLRTTKGGGGGGGEGKCVLGVLGGEGGGEVEMGKRVWNNEKVPFHLFVSSNPAQSYQSSTLLKLFSTPISHTLQHLPHFEQFCDKSQEQLIGLSIIQL